MYNAQKALFHNIELQINSYGRWIFFNGRGISDGIVLLLSVCEQLFKQIVFQYSIKTTVLEGLSEVLQLNAWKENLHFLLLVKRQHDSLQKLKSKYSFRILNQT